MITQKTRSPESLATARFQKSCDDVTNVTVVLTLKKPVTKIHATVTDNHTGQSHE